MGTGGEGTLNASVLVKAGAFSGAELRRARESGLRLNSTRIANIARERNRISGVFKSFDRDNDGVLSADEFSCALRRVNPELRDAQVREYASHIAKDKHGKIMWPEFCEKLGVAAQTCRTHTPAFLKGSRWIDNGDIIGNTNDDVRHLHDGVIPMEFHTTTNAHYSPPKPDMKPPAGTQSFKMMQKERSAMHFDEWDALNTSGRRSRGVQSTQSGGLRFDERGFQAGTVGRGAAQPSPRPRTLVQMGMQSSAMRECLQPDVAVARPRTSAPVAQPQRKEVVLHMRHAPPTPTSKAVNATY
ncbi:hypothetical protein T492DRAFT_1106522 [Pavlovales sp. CCMP2436]|nr:hypothetical protein T492DRAFT_1106522 [Pavlovales sp. CCMP2436]